jgi:hypothetical protein
MLIIVRCSLTYNCEIYILHVNILLETIILDSAYNEYYDNLRRNGDMSSSQNDTKNRFWEGGLTNG